MVTMNVMAYPLVLLALLPAAAAAPEKPMQHTLQLIQGRVTQAQLPGWPAWLPGCPRRPVARLAMPGCRLVAFHW